MHIGVDKATGIIHTVETTPANVHDATKVDELRRPGDWKVIGDPGISAWKNARAQILSA